jgi:hypothetical protein
LALSCFGSGCGVLLSAYLRFTCGNLRLIQERSLAGMRRAEILTRIFRDSVLAVLSIGDSPQSAASELASLTASISASGSGRVV